MSCAKGEEAYHKSLFAPHNARTSVSCIGRTTLPSGSGYLRGRPLLTCPCVCSEKSPICRRPARAKCLCNLPRASKSDSIKLIALHTTGRSAHVTGAILRGPDVLHQIKAAFRKVCLKVLRIETESPRFAGTL